MKRKRRFEFVWWGLYPTWDLWPHWVDWKRWFAKYEREEGEPWTRNRPWKWSLWLGPLESRRWETP